MLHIGQLIKLSKLITNKKQSNETMVKEILTILDPNCEKIYAEASASRIINCKCEVDNFMDLNAYVQYESIINSIINFKNKFLNQSKLKVLVIAIYELLKNEYDEYLSDNTTKIGMLFENKNIIFEELFAELLLYTKHKTNKQENDESFVEITDDYLNDIDESKYNFLVSTDEPVENYNLKASVNNINYNILNEFYQMEKINVTNNSFIKAYTLKADNILNKFVLDNLQKALLANIGRYIFTRKEIQNFITRGESEMIVLNAIQKMKKSPDYEIKASELIHYLLMEVYAKAPKIYSSFELKEDKDEIHNTESVYLISFKDKDKTIKSQMAFGLSNIIGNYKEAIDDSFNKIYNIIEHRDTISNIIVDKLSIHEIMPYEESRKFVEFIKPRKHKEEPVEKAITLFIGYTLELDNSSSSFYEKVKAKLKSDIHDIIAYVNDKITSLHLENFSFYVFVIPFNDADKEKDTIIEDLKGKVM